MAEDASTQYLKSPSSISSLGLNWVSGSGSRIMPLKFNGVGISRQRLRPWASHEGQTGSLAEPVGHWRCEGTHCGGDVHISPNESYRRFIRDHFGVNSHSQKVRETVAHESREPPSITWPSDGGSAIHFRTRRNPLFEYQSLRRKNCFEGSTKVSRRTTCLKMR